MPPFLTALDSRAAVKGSRDPLGIQAIWTRFGRHVVGNLTTVSTSVRDFTVLLLGYHFAERVAASGETGTELATFLKWEQLAAYARGHVNEEYGFRGTQRVMRRLAEGNRMTISPDREHQILANQKIYGLWGLYTVPARSSGLVEPDSHRLTPVAHEFVQANYLSQLAKRGLGNGEQIVRMLGREQYHLHVDKRDADLLKAAASMLRSGLSEVEREFYREHLLLGGPEDRTRGLQRSFVDLIQPTLTEEDFAFDPVAVHALARESRRDGGEDDELAHRLDRIAVCETLVAPSSALFSFLLSYHGADIGEIARDIRLAWGERLPHIDPEPIADLRAEIASAYDAEVAERWLQIGAGLHQGEYERAVELLLLQNGQVMAWRGGSAPWAELRKGKLHVRFRDESGFLPKRDELPRLWRFSYFLDSVHSMARTLSGEAA